MNSRKIGDYISTLRKNKNLTQKELADQLGVTDKAVSKWERGAGYPDISMLKPLAAVLGTTVNELLEGEASEKADEINQDGISHALEYADKIIALKKHKIGTLIASILSITLLLAIFTSVIVNVAVSHKLSWSIIVIGSCVMGGCLLIPPLLKKKQGFLISLSLLTLLIMPFLGTIQAVTLKYNPVFTIDANTKALTAVTVMNSSNWLWAIALPTSITWLVIIWLLVLLQYWKKLSIWFLASITLLLCIPGHIITNNVVNHYVESLASNNSNQITTVSTVTGLLALAGMFFVIGMAKRNPSESYL